MKYEIEVPEYIKEKGLRFVWEQGYTIQTNLETNTIVLSANAEGLISLARHMLMLAQTEIPPGSHVHLDDSNSLEDGSCEFVITKI